MTVQTTQYRDYETWLAKQVERLEQALPADLLADSAALCQSTGIQQYYPMKRSKTLLWALGVMGLSCYLFFQTGGWALTELPFLKGMASLHPPRLATLIDSVGDESDHAPNAIAMPAIAQKTDSTQVATGPLKAPVGLNGRDPFAPLITAPTEGTPAGGGGIGFSPSGFSPALPTAPPNVLDSIEFTGMIDDASAKGKVAILNVQDSSQGQKTLVKKMGEHFVMDGHRVVLTRIQGFQLHLLVDGKPKTKHLAPFTDTVNAPEKESAEQLSLASPSEGKPETKVSNGMYSFSLSPAAMAPRADRLPVQEP